MPLELSPDEFRALGARVVEDAAGYLTTLGERQIVPPLSGADSLAAFDAPIPEEGLGPAAFDDLARVEPAAAPARRFFGYVLGSGEPVAALGDLYAWCESERDGLALVAGGSPSSGRRGRPRERARLPGLHRQPDRWRLRGEPDGAGDGTRGASAGQRGRGAPRRGGLRLL